MRKKQSPLKMIVKVVNKIQPYDDNYNLSIFFLPNHDNYFILITDPFLKKFLVKIFFIHTGLVMPCMTKKHYYVCMSNKGGAL